MRSYIEHWCEKGLAKITQRNCVKSREAKKITVVTHGWTKLFWALIFSIVFTHLRTIVGFDEKYRQLPFIFKETPATQRHFQLDFFIFHIFCVNNWRKDHVLHRCILWSRGTNWWLLILDLYLFTDRFILSVIYRIKRQRWKFCLTLKNLEKKHWNPLHWNPLMT